MATATARRTSKTAFLTGFFKKNPTANSTAVNRAWAKAGNPGKVSPSLVSKLRSGLGLAGNIRTTTRTPVAAPTTKTARPGKTAPNSKGKSSFIKEVLFDDPKANTAAVNRVWKANGMKGTISASLVNKVRSDLGLTGNLRTGAKASVSKKATRKTGKAPTVGVHVSPSSEKKHRPGNRERMLAEVEDKIDRLVFELLEIGGVEKAEDALRAARRVLVRAQKA
jgi:hypothetical protein